MSHNPNIAQKRRTIPQLVHMKGREKIVCLTAYSAPIATLLDEHVDLLLVGDSLGMVLYGMQSTLPVTLEMMIAHGAATVRASSRALVMIDMPFASYQQSPAQAFANAARLVQETGCQAIKVEGAMEMLETVSFVSQRGIPVMAHIGLRPQNIHQMGGYKYQGRDDEAAQELLKQARAFEQAGAFGLLLEGITEPVAKAITQAVGIPTIGIGASPECDGQVLVTEDMLGLNETPPRFVKCYADLRTTISNSAKHYASEVKKSQFPSPEHCFKASISKD